MPYEAAALLVFIGAKLLKKIVSAVAVKIILRLCDELYVVSINTTRLINRNAHNQIMHKMYE